MKIINRLFLNDKFILVIIVINTFTIFFEGFENTNPIASKIIIYIDLFTTFLFVLEIAVKIKHYGRKKYIASIWHKLDVVLVILSLPSLMLVFNFEVSAGLHYLLVFRIARVFRFFRFFKFIPGIAPLMRDITRALKTSVVILFGFIIYNLIVSVLSCYLFREMSPEYFGNPIVSFYSMFKVFTVEGWYEIPDKMLASTSIIKSFFVKAYFIIILITGGIGGLSLVNSIFVDSMVSDNNDELEKKIDELNKKIDLLIKEQKKSS